MTQRGTPVSANPVDFERQDISRWCNWRMKINSELVDQMHHVKPGFATLPNSLTRDRDQHPAPGSRRGKYNKATPAVASIVPGTSTWKAQFGLPRLTTANFSTVNRRSKSAPSSPRDIRTFDLPSQRTWNSTPHLSNWSPQTLVRPAPDYNYDGVLSRPVSERGSDTNRSWTKLRSRLGHHFRQDNSPVSAKHHKTTQTEEVNEAPSKRSSRAKVEKTTHSSTTKFFPRVNITLPPSSPIQQVGIPSEKYRLPPDTTANAPEAPQSNPHMYRKTRYPPIPPRDYDRPSNGFIPADCNTSIESTSTFETEPSYSGKPTDKRLFSRRTRDSKGTTQNRPLHQTKQGDLRNRPNTRRTFSPTLVTSTDTDDTSGTLTRRRHHKISRLIEKRRGETPIFASAATKYTTFSGSGHLRGIAPAVQAFPESVFIVGHQDQPHRHQHNAHRDSSGFRYYPESGQNGIDYHRNYRLVNDLKGKSNSTRLKDKHHRHHLSEKENPDFPKSYIQNGGYPSSSRLIPNPAAQRQPGYFVTDGPVMSSKHVTFRHGSRPLDTYVHTPGPVVHF